MVFVFTNLKDPNYKNIYSDYLSELARTDSYYLEYRDTISYKFARNVILVLEENTVIAFAAIGAKGKKINILALYVIPSHRNKNVGYQLLKYIENYYYCQFLYVNINIRNNNAPLINLLSKNGYAKKALKGESKYYHLFDQYEKKLIREYNYLIVNVDTALFDVNISYEFAIFKIFKKYKVSNSKNNRMLFKSIDDEALMEYRKKEINYSTYIKVKFKRFFNKLGKNINIDECIDLYNESITKSFLISNSAKILKKLSKRFRIFFITEYTKYDIENKLKQYGLSNISTEIYSTFDLCIEYPSKELFLEISNDSSDPRWNRYCVIGSNEEKDMEFAIINKLDTIFLNLKNKKTTRNNYYYTKNLPNYKWIYKVLKRY